MNRALVDRIADAVLYEGYVLYPYRPSVKNRQRWTFGGLYPAAWCAAHGSGDASTMQTECLVLGGTRTTVKTTVRFLHLLECGGADCQPRQEAVERRIEGEELLLCSLVDHLRRVPFQLPASRQSDDGIVREQAAIEGAVEMSAQRVAEELADVKMLPWYAAVRAHALGDRRHLLNLVVEARPAAEAIYDEIQKRRERLAIAPVGKAGQELAVRRLRGLRPSDHRHCR